MKRLFTYIYFISFSLSSACSCVLYEGDRDIYCGSVDNSLLRIDEREFTFRVSSDSVVFTESNDSMHVHYAELRFSPVIIDLYLHRPTSATFVVDTTRSRVVLLGQRGVDADTLRLTNASMITETYVPGTCCQARGCWRNTPDRMQAEVLGILQSKKATRAIYFNIDIITEEDESVEC